MVVWEREKGREGVALGEFYRCRIYMESLFVDTHRMRSRELFGGDNDTLRTSAAAHGEPRVVLIK